MPAVGALIEVTPERGGATPRNGPQHFDVLPADPPAASLDEAVSRSGDEIGNFQDGPVHLLILQHQQVEMGHGNFSVTHTYTSNDVRRRVATFKRCSEKLSPRSFLTPHDFYPCFPCSGLRPLCVMFSLLGPPL
jgi:hypothetical protein